MFNLQSQLGYRSPSVRRLFSYSHVIGAGHNKWSKIKQKKGANDAQKGSIFGKASRDIVAAVRNGGSTDPSKNLQLAAALRWAKEQDVPKENIEKALAKAGQRKDTEGGGFIYEALAYNSVGLIIDCSTDNTNRTIHSLREILNEHNARATPVMFMFQRKGCVLVKLEKTDTKEVVEVLAGIALDGGADDFDNVESGDGAHILKFTCQPDALARLTDILGEREHMDVYGWRLMGSDLAYVPLDTIPDESEELKTKLKGLINDLETNEDVLKVWTSVDLTGLKTGDYC